MIKPAILLTAVLFSVAPVWAINKCTGPDGKVSYQEAPCASKESGQTLKVPQTAVANGSTSGKQLPFKLVELSAGQIQEIAAAGMAVAKARLKDPESAKFADVRVLSFSAQGKVYTMTCGGLNAKNSYGGYVGSKPFWVYDGIFTEAFDHYLPGSNLAWLMGNVQASCLKDGAAAALN